MRRSCVTTTALAAVTATGQTLLAKNSDRTPRECQPLVQHERRSHPAGAMVPCQFVPVPPVEVTLRHVEARLHWCCWYRLQESYAALYNRREGDAAMAEFRYLGVGLYTIPEAARLLRVPVVKLRRWAHGYSFADGRYSTPMCRRDYPELAEHGILTFQELIELCLVSQFRQAGVSMQTIRTTARWAAELFETNHPFAVRRFHTDGKRLFAERELPAEKGVPQRVYQELPTCQYVFEQVTESFFKKLNYEADLVRHYWPLGKDRPVVLDPARTFGEPIDSGSGVPTRLLYEMHRAGQSMAEVADWFRVDREAVRAAIEYEQSLAPAA